MSKLRSIIERLRQMHPNQRRILFGAPSDMGQIVVLERAGIRYLVMGQSTQSAWDPRKPQKIVQGYPRLLLAAFAAWPGHAVQRPCRVLLIGLGGGIIQRHLAHFYPHVEQLTIEINPVMPDLCKRYFGLDPSIQVQIADGTAFIRDAHPRFDVIILDAFDGTYIPAPFMTRDFFAHARAKLEPDGFFLSNFWEGSATQTEETSLWLSAFKEGFDIRNPERRQGNRILAGGPGVPLDFAEFRKRAGWTLASLGILDLDPRRLFSRTTRITLEEGRPDRSRR